MLAVITQLGFPLPLWVEVDAVVLAERTLGYTKSLGNKVHWTALAGYAVRLGLVLVPKAAAGVAVAGARAIRDDA